MGIQPETALILVVDDDPFMRHMLTHYLRREGYRVVEATNGTDALDLYLSHQPDLVLLDVLMPGLSGFEVCQRLNSLPNEQPAPVLIITGLEDEKSVDQAFEMGAADYVTKPLNWAVLRQRVRRLIQQHRLGIQLREANSQLQQLTLTDSLTQVANRRRFDEYLLQEWGQAVREHLPLALIICDIDHFKGYNDHYGHPAGDRALQQVATCLNQSINRPTDMVTRYGGEEFAIILPDTDLVGAMVVGNRLIKALGRLDLCHATSPTAPHLTLSCGTTSLTPNIKDLPSDLVSTADQALYQAKAQGRNQIHAITVPRYCPDPTLEHGVNVPLSDPTLASLSCHG